jgi:hypothetical protein
MRRIVKRLPTPAMIVAVVALILALGGSAIAGGVLTTKKFKKQAIRGPVTYVTVPTVVNNNNDPGPGPVSGVNITAACPSGFFPTGGGVKSGNLSNNSGLIVQYSYPSAPNGWTANVFAGTAGGGGLAETISVTAVCVKAKQSSGVLPGVTL